MYFDRDSKFGNLDLKYTMVRQGVENRSPGLAIFHSFNRK